jgi:hypothetical protein
MMANTQSGYGVTFVRGKSTWGGTKTYPMSNSHVWLWILSRTDWTCAAALRGWGPMRDSWGVYLPARKRTPQTQSGGTAGWWRANRPSRRCWAFCLSWCGCLHWSCTFKVSHFFFHTEKEIHLSAT